jgi:tRNA (guanine37-N1)-methyltransferase
MVLHVDILTLFPEMFPGVLDQSILGRARKAGLVQVELTNIRDHSTDRHRKVDDRPYGGGPGMVLRPEPVFAAVEAVLERARAPEAETRKIVLSPQGRRLDQKGLRDLAAARWLVLLCGHYEGFDERILEGTGFEELSIGDYVLSGGELPAMVVLDGVVRLLPGALGHPRSAEEDSFETNVLDHPQYTRPAEYRGMQVPEVLVSGNHEKIAEWRREEALRRTTLRRADLLGCARGASNENTAERSVSDGQESYSALDPSWP